MIQPRLLFLVLCYAASSVRAQVPAPAVTFGEAEVAPETFAEAQQLAAKGRLDQAMNVLNQLAAQTPVPAGVHRLRGLIFYEQGRLSEAANAFAQAMAQDRLDLDAAEMEGVSLFRLGHSGQALPYLEQARQRHVADANVEPNYVLGLCYADLGRYDDARHAFAAQYGFGGDSPEAYLLAARLFLRRELRDQATAQAARALQLNPGLPLAHELLAEAALARGDAAGAIRELESERRINPLSGEVYDRLGDAYLRSSQYEQARTALDRAVVLEPSATGPYILLGETLLSLKQPINALQYLRRADSMDPSNYITHNLLGQAYKAIGNMAEANREFKRAVELQHSGEPKQAGK